MNDKMVHQCAILTSLKLWEAMRTNSDWENVAYMVVLILLVVYIFDTISNMLRSRLMGAASR